MKRFIKSVALTLIALCYPLLVYLAITHNISWVFPVFVGIIFIRRFYAQGDTPLLYGLIALLLFAGAIFYQTLAAKMIPVLIHTSLFLIFYRSLQTESSLIERFARLDFPILPPGIAEYCRQVTWLWTGFFFLNILVCSGLAIWANNAIWALYNGGVIYLLLGSMVICEYIWRRFRYPWLEIPPLKQSMMNIVKNGHTIWNSK